MMRTKYSKTEKAEHWQQWKQSGLSQRKYCERHGLKQSSFKNWGRAQAMFPLVPVILKPESNIGIKVTWNHCTIELPVDATQHQWRNLLSAISEQSTC
jgi:hypothetical protein